MRISPLLFLLIGTMLFTPNIIFGMESSMIALDLGGGMISSEDTDAESPIFSLDCPVFMKYNADWGCEIWWNSVYVVVFVIVIVIILIGAFVYFVYRRSKKSKKN